MRILQIFKSVLMSNEGIVDGGLEKVVVDTHEVLLSYGYDSHVIDATESKYDGPNVHRLLDSNKTSIVNSNNIADLAKTFDAVIVHSHNTIVKYLNDRKIPFIFVDHLALISLNKLFHEDTFNKEWVRAKSNGSKYVTVSKVAQEFKEANYKKWNSDFYFDGHIKFQFVTSELEQIQVQEAGDYTTVIARPSSEKKMHLIEKLGYPFKIYSMNPNEGGLRNDHQEYYETRLKGLEENIFWNFPRDEMMVSLSKAFAYYSTCPVESAGISAFEALCSGVPVILNETRRKHSSRIFAPEGCDYICAQSDKESIERFKGFSLAKRLEIAAEVREYNSPDQFISSFIGLCESVQNVPELSLENFMHA